MTDTLEKRTHVYVMRPRAYEVAGCPCGNNDPDWSEYKKHLWCQKCGNDFIPEHNGIFDGPVGLGLCEVLGIDLRRMNLETQEIEGVHES